MAQARKRQTVQDILESQRVQRQRMSEQLAFMSARGTENPNVNYALSKFGSGFGSALADSIFGESDELKQARVNDAATENAINTERRQNYILKNSFDSLGMFSQENADEAGRIFDEVVNPQQKSPGGTGTVAAEQPVAANGNELATGQGTFNPQGAQAQDYTIPQKVEGLDVFTSKVDTPPAEPTREERDAWLRKTQPGDYARAFSGVTGTAIEKDKQLWQLYRDSLNGNRPVFK